MGFWDAIAQVGVAGRPEAQAHKGAPASPAHRPGVGAQHSLSDFRKRALQDVLGHRLPPATGNSSPAAPRPAATAERLQHAGFRDISEYRATLVSADRLEQHERRTLETDPSSVGDTRELTRKHRAARALQERLASEQQQWDLAHVPTATPQQLKLHGFKNQEQFAASFRSAHRSLGHERSNDSAEPGLAVVPSASTRGDRGELTHRQREALTLRAEQQLGSAGQAQQQRLRAVHSATSHVESQAPHPGTRAGLSEVATFSTGMVKGAAGAFQDTFRAVAHPINTLTTLGTAAGHAAAQMDAQGASGALRSAKAGVQRSVETALTTQDEGGRLTGNLLANAALVTAPGARIATSPRLASLGATGTTISLGEAGGTVVAQAAATASQRLAQAAPALQPVIQAGTRTVGTLSEAARLPGRALDTLAETRAGKAVSNASAQVRSTLQRDVRDLGPLRRKPAERLSQPDVKAPRTSDIRPMHDPGFGQQDAFRPTSPEVADADVIAAQQDQLRTMRSSLARPAHTAPTGTSVSQILAQQRASQGAGVPMQTGLAGVSKPLTPAAAPRPAKVSVGPADPAIHAPTPPRVVSNVPSEPEMQHLTQATAPLGRAIDVLRADGLEFKVLRNQGFEDLLPDLADRHDMGRFNAETPGLYEHNSKTVILRDAPDGSVESDWLANHEVGHAVAHKAREVVPGFESRLKELYERQKALFPSRYATETPDEYFAESLAAYSTQPRTSLRDVGEPSPWPSSEQVLAQGASPLPSQGRLHSSALPHFPAEHRAPPKSLETATHTMRRAQAHADTRPFSDGNGRFLHPERYHMTRVELMQLDSEMDLFIQHVLEHVGNPPGSPP